MIIKIISNFPDALNGKQDMRFTYLANLLVKRGHNVELIISDFDHEVKDVRKRDDYSVYDFKITALHEPTYSNNLSLKRLYAHYRWGKSVGMYLYSLSVVPDVLYVPIPSLTAAREAATYCKKNPSCKYVVDIQDLWPEAFQMLVKNALLKKAFFPFSLYVNYAYRNADFIIGVSDTYRDRALSVNKKLQAGLTVFLGNDGGLFDEGKKLFYVEKPENEFWLAYIGTMGFSYDLNCIVDAIRIVNERRRIEKRVKFIAMGRGPLLEDFKAYAEKSGIDYEFTGALPYQEMVGKMCSCDVVMNCIKPGAAQSITNKVGDYALSGLPVINTQENQEYRNLVNEYQCGINCDCGNSIEVADAIEKLAMDTDLRKAMGEQARKLGVEKFDRRFTYLQIVDALEKIVSLN